MLSAEELLAGGTLDFEVRIPAEVLTPALGETAGEGTAGAGHDRVRLRPLTVHDLQLISRAAKENDQLTATLMVQRALLEPELSVAQVNTMHAGLMQYLLQKVKQISGIDATPQQIDEVMAAPLVKAAFVLSREFGWTPQEVNDLTLGQVLLNLEMLEQSHVAGARN